MNSFLSEDEIDKMKFKSCGKNVYISRNAVFYNTQNIMIGNHVRIDDFSFISGGKGIEIGNYVHISCYCALYGTYQIEIHDYVNISCRCIIFSTSDDYSGQYLTGPLVPQEYIHNIGKKIIINKLAIIGAGSVLLPGTEICEGAAIGAMSLVKSKIPQYEIWAGVPVKYIKNRKKTMKDILYKL